MSVLGCFAGVELYHGRIIKKQRALEAEALRVFLCAKVADVHADEAQASVQASRVSTFDRRSILRASRPSSCW